jgi:hypothetical protein
MNTNKSESHINQNEYSALKPNVKFSTFNSPTNSKHKRIQLQKKKSRISLAVEKTSSTETLSERETKASSFSSCESPTESPKHITYNGYLITVNISVVMLNNIKRISFDVNSNTKIAMIIDKAITEFNKEFINDNANIRIKDEPECFVLKPAKKNGQPKTDLPFFNEHMVVHETKRENFALCWKDDPDDYQQMFKSKQKNNDCMCFIF